MKVHYLFIWVLAFEFLSKYLSLECETESLCLMIEDIARCIISPYSVGVFNRFNLIFPCTDSMYNILLLHDRNKLCLTKNLSHVKWRNSEKGFTSRYTTGN